MPGLEITIPTAPDVRTARATDFFGRDLRLIKLYDISHFKLRCQSFKLVVSASQLHLLKTMGLTTSVQAAWVGRKSNRVIKTLNQYFSIKTF